MKDVQGTYSTLKHKGTVLQFLLFCGLFFITWIRIRIPFPMRIQIDYSGSWSKPCQKVWIRDSQHWLTLLNTTKRKVTNAESGESVFIKDGNLPKRRIFFNPTDVTDTRQGCNVSISSFTFFWQVPVSMLIWNICTVNAEVQKLLLNATSIIPRSFH